MSRLIAFVPNVNKSIYTEEHARFVSTLNRIREQKGMTQIALANAVGKPQSYISKCLSGERRIDFVEWLHLCTAVQVTPTEFLLEYEKIIQGH